MTTLDVALEVGRKGRRVGDAVAAARARGREPRGGGGVTGGLPGPLRAGGAAGGSGAQFSSTARPRVVVTYPGVGATDVWGISFASCGLDEAPLGTAAFACQLELLAAAWRFFDRARERLRRSAHRPARRRAGPRGDRRSPAARSAGRGPHGRGRAGRGTARRSLGPRPPPRGVPPSTRRPPRRRSPGADLDAALLVRHSAFHVLDHAWEMRDGDLRASGDAFGST